MKKVPVLTITATGKVKTYESVRATARALGGAGKEATYFNRVRSAVVTNGGGYVGNTYVANGTNYTG